MRGIEIFWWYCLHKVKNYFFLKVVLTLGSEVGLGSAAFGGWHFQYKSTAKREREKMRRTKRMKVKVRALFSSRKKSSVATRMSI